MENRHTLNSCRSIFDQIGNPLGRGRFAGLPPVLALPGLLADHQQQDLGEDLAGFLFLGGLLLAVELVLIVLLEE